MGFFDFFKQNKPSPEAVISTPPKKDIPKTYATELPKICQALSKVFSLGTDNCSEVYKNIYDPYGFSKSVVKFCFDEYGVDQLDILIFYTSFYSYFGAILSTKLLGHKSALSLSSSLWDDLCKKILLDTEQYGDDDFEVRVERLVSKIFRGRFDAEEIVTKIESFYSDEAEYWLTQSVFDENPESVLTVAEYAYKLGLLVAKKYL